jgi:hypothetical protein
MWVKKPSSTLMREAHEEESKEKLRSVVDETSNTIQIEGRPISPSQVQVEGLNGTLPPYSQTDSSIQHTATVAWDTQTYPTMNERYQDTEDRKSITQSIAPHHFRNSVLRRESTLLDETRGNTDQGLERPTVATYYAYKTPGRVDYIDKFHSPRSQFTISNRSFSGIPHDSNNNSASELRQLGPFTIKDSPFGTYHEHEVENNVLNEPRRFYAETYPENYGSRGDVYIHNSSDKYYDGCYYDVPASPNHLPSFKLSTGNEELIGSVVGWNSASATP